MTVQEIATDFSGRFVQATRDTGATYWMVTDDKKTPELEALCILAGDAEDWRYAFLVDALNELSEHAQIDDARDALEADIYTSELTAWLGSRASRFEYCDEVMEEYGKDAYPGMVELIQWGQLEEKKEVFDLVAAELKKLADASEEG